MFYYTNHIPTHHVSHFDAAPSARSRVIVAMHEEREIPRLRQEQVLSDQQFGAWLRKRA